MYRSRTLTTRIDNVILIVYESRREVGVEIGLTESVVVRIPTVPSLKRI